MTENLIIDLQKKLKENPNDATLIEEYAIALSDIGENEEALKNFIYLKKIFPESPLVYYNIGIILEKLKKYDDAIIAYERAHSLSQDDTDIMFNLAYAYLKSENYDDSEKLFLKIIDKDNFDENAYFHLGEIYSRKKMHEKAIEFLSKAIELDETDAIARFYLAYEFKSIDKVDLAIEHYNKVININPDYSWAYYNLALIYLEQNIEDQAILYLEKTIKTNPLDIKAIKLLVKLFSKNKKFAAAEKLLRQAMHDLPEEADIYYLLAQVHNSMKSKINYIKYLKYALKRKLTFTGDVEKLEEEINDAEKSK